MEMKRDFTAGLALMIGGAVFALYATYSLPIGTVRQMGPGMLPMGLGVLLAFFGLLIFVPAFFRDEIVPKANPRALVAVLVSVVVFSAAIRPLGLVPAVVATTALSSLALPGSRPLVVLAIAAALIVLTWFIFIYLLNLPIALLPWRT